jgi:anti-sigma factor RsiW
MFRRTPDPSSELAALADGSLAPKRAHQLEQETAASPELAALLDEQRRAIALVGAVQAPAPERLHARVEALVADSSRARAGRRPWPALGRGLGRLRPGLALSSAFGVALVAAALVVFLPGGAGAPTVVQAAALAHRPATMPAPAKDGTELNLLAAAQSGVSYPYWQDKFGWRAVGARTDRLAGRDVTTVFYANHGGARIGYSIVAGRQVPAPADATVLVRNEVRLSVVRRGASTIVTWLRSGHSCVLSGRGVAPSMLERLASWRARDTIPY